MAVAARAQAVHGVVVDQTGLPLPGVTIQLLNGSATTSTLTTGPDGTFTLDPSTPGETVTATLDGFETSRVPRAEAAHIVLAIAHTTETATVVAPTIAAASPTVALLGSTLTATNIARLPSTRMKARESLPLLPSVVRGPDGLMELGGARAWETPIILDGFNITDPATGLSSLNLPFEAVRGIDALRDPMSISYGRLIGGLVNMQTTSGGDAFTSGLQSFIPRPRLSSPGFGRIEGVFPRAYAGGSAAAGRLRYFGAIEYDYERVAVPDVTSAHGPAVVDQSAVGFLRLDVQFSPRQTTTVEGFLFPYGRQNAGLSPKRVEDSTVDQRGTDWFGGITHRFVQNQSSVFTLQFGVLKHSGRFLPNGTGTAYLSPDGWAGNWFASADRQSARYSVEGSWERISKIAGQTHDMTFTGDLVVRRLTGHVVESPIVVSDVNGRTVRAIEFGAAATIQAGDLPLGVSARDVWHVTERLQFDTGIRVDDVKWARATPSARFGFRYELDPEAKTVLKGGYGGFVGAIGLMVPAFAGYPLRIDRTFDPGSGRLVSERQLQPSTGTLDFPHAVAATIGVEHQFSRGLDGQVTVTNRRTTHIATLSVPAASGPELVASDGSGTYRDVQVSVRKLLGHDQQVFVSYVRSSARGELNDFVAMAQAVDAPIVRPGGQARLSTSAPHRVLMWGTFNLPSAIVISPVVEWRSGFPYSTYNAHYAYAGQPNSEQYPAFVSADMIVYKTFTVKDRSADIGMQIFNLTNHNNPRDVYSVVGTPRFGEFTNSVGPVLRGYMLLKW
jgi:hypothetical protein